MLALVSLIEFCRRPSLVAAAEALLDKTLFSLAVNSWRGIHGCAHGRSYAQTLKSARLEETGPIQWLCWGMGSLNEAVLPVVALATARRYELPPAVREAGLRMPEEWWGTQRCAGEYRFEHDLLDRAWESHTAVWKTPDVMLASAQDYRPGLAGLQEHVWGTTLGPEAHIFATHPANSATNPSTRPNAWSGNRILPRVRQDRDTLLALYRVPADDAMGFTHAWFPASHLDEWRQVGCWTAGRLGDGYVALACAGGAEPHRRGPGAGQELMPRGDGRAWVCQVGRKATHGSFAEFCAALGEPRFATEEVAYRTPDGRLLELGWDTPFLVDGVPKLLTEAAHIDNPYAHVPFGAPRMRIEVGDLTHDIDLARACRLRDLPDDRAVGWER